MNRIKGKDIPCIPGSSEMGFYRAGEVDGNGTNKQRQSMEIWL